MTLQAAAPLHPGPVSAAAARRLPSAGPRMRLLMVTARYFPYVGGVEKHVYEVARRLARHGVDVTVLTTDPGGQLPASEQLEGVNIRRMRAWPAGAELYFAPGIYRAIPRGDWDLVHVQCYHTFVAPLAMLAALRAGIPYVVTFHGGGHSSHLRNAARGIQRALLRPLLARAERLIAVARFEIDMYGKELRVPATQFALIPNGSDLPKVTHAGLPPGNHHQTLIASVGRLERYKGHQRIIAALPTVLEQRPDARLWIAGQGPYEPALRRLAEQLGVADHVEIRGIPAAERERMAAELSRAALVVLLSEYETHPIAVIEALSLGCPVLVADNSGLSELAQLGLARAIPLNSSDRQVGMAVLEQLSQPRPAVNLELPTWDDCAADLLALYRSVARRPVCAS